MILTEAIRRYCKQQNIGVRELARYAGIDPMAASRFLSGKSVKSSSFSLILAWTLRTPSQSEIEHQE